MEFYFPVLVKPKYEVFNIKNIWRSVISKLLSFRHQATLGGGVSYKIKLYWGKKSELLLHIFKKCPKNVLIRLPREITLLIIKYFTGFTPWNIWMRDNYFTWWNSRSKTFAVKNIFFFYTIRMFYPSDFLIRLSADPCLNHSNWLAL